jgi:hypothetical protein
MDVLDKKEKKRKLINLQMMERIEFIKINEFKQKQVRSAANRTMMQTNCLFMIFFVILG